MRTAKIWISSVRVLAVAAAAAAVLAGGTPATRSAVQLRQPAVCAGATRIILADNGQETHGKGHRSIA